LTSRLGLWHEFKMPQTKRTNAAMSEQLESLHQEYQALYGLVGLRIGLLERRSPVIGASLTAVLAGLSGLEGDARLFLLFAIPAALIWFARTTVSHARSLEDLYRRIEVLETRINGLIGAETMGFQASHPGRGESGGRTSRELVLAVLSWSLLLLVGCGALSGLSGRAWLLFAVYLLTVGIYLLTVTRAQLRYRYRSAESTSRPA